MSTANPYAPPEHVATGGDDRLEAMRRTNLLHRRTVAFLIDGLLYFLTVGAPLCAWASSATASAHWIDVRNGVVNPTLGDLCVIVVVLAIPIPMFLFRDLFGATSPGKRAVGLGIERMDGRGTPGLGPRIVRNVTCVVPGAPVVEYVLAYFGGADMQRLGDRIARTRVVDRAPARYGGSNWRWRLVAAVIVTCAGYRFFLTILLPLWARILGVSLTI